MWISEQSWWATRRTPLPPGALRYRLYATVTAGTPQELRAEIEEQMARQRRYVHRPRRLYPQTPGAGRGRTHNPP